MATDLERLKNALFDRYAIESEIGRGGMATVYLAEDLKHRRKVAVKVLDPEISAVVGTERFLAEIETTANLQHPHILPLFDSGEADGLLFYVMPFIEGESLRDRLERETHLPVEDALRIATEVADGLGHAHGLGVIHRDIKPENILLSGGHALIADFGIARAVSVAGGSRLTETGLSLGTPQYMSPEQASGEQEVDARSDVYALGCVTFEMLAGEPPHTGPNAQAIIAKILTEPVRSVRESRETVPPALDHAVWKALSRLPADRWQTAADFSAALDEPHEHTTGAWERAPGIERHLTPGRRGRGMPVWARVAGGGLLVAVAALGWLSARWTAPAPPPDPVFSFTVPAQGGLPGGWYPRIAVSPDGQTLAYMGSEGLVIHPMGPEDPVLVEDTRGSTSPAFSPDGEWIAFIRDGAIRKVASGGGAVSTFSSTPGLPSPVGITWRNDSTIIYVRTDSQLWEVSDRGGTARQVTTLADSAGETAHFWPHSFDDGRQIVFTILEVAEGESRVVVENLLTGQRVDVAEQASTGRYLPTGHILYSTVGGTLLAVPFDSKRGEVTGAAFPVETGVRVGYYVPTAWFAVSEAGTFAFVPGSDYANHRIVWLDREGKEVGQIGPSVSLEKARLSPDGRKIAAYLAQPGRADIYFIEAESGRPQRVTFGAGVEDNPIWSPDGRRLAYHSFSASMEHRIEILEVEGSGTPEVIYSTTRGWLYPYSWSQNGWLAFTQVHEERGYDVYAVRVDSIDHVLPVVETPFGESSAQFHPDGRWLAYDSDESGQWEVYVVSFPDLTGKRQITTGGAMSPFWSSDGQGLFFMQAGTLMSTRVSTDGGVFRWETPEPLSTGPVAGVTPDGERFLAVRRDPDSWAREIHVVTNWFEVLKEKAKGGR